MKAAETANVLRRAALLAAAIAAFASCTTAPARPVDPIAVVARASRTDYEGIPLIRLKGSPYEVGYQYGALVRRELAEVQGEFSSLLDVVLGSGIKRWAADSYLASEAKKTLANLPAEYAEELRGVAEGSGRPFQEVLILAMTPELLFDVNCSSVVTRGGRLVHARNFDFYFPGSIAAKHPLVARYEIEGRRPFVNVGFVGLFGCYTGANDAGLCATEDTAIFSRKPEGPCVPVGYALRMALEGCGSLAEVRALYSGMRTRGYIVAVSSLAEDDASVFELVGGGCVENRMSGGSIRVTNRCLSEENRLRNELLLADFDVNTARESALDRVLAREEGDPVARAKELVSDRSFSLTPKLPPLQSLLQDAMRTVNNYTSIQSAIFDPSARAVHVSWREGYAASAPYARIGLDDLSASPSFPGDGLLESEDYLKTRDFVSRMHDELLKRGFSFSTEDYRRLYPEVLAADLPELAKEDWVLSFALRLGDWPRAEACAARLTDLLPGSYYGPFWRGFSLLRQDRPAEARARFLEAASASALSPCADFVVSLYLAEAEAALGSDPARFAALSRAKGILARYEYTEGLAEAFGKYFADPGLEKKVGALVSELERERKR